MYRSWAFSRPETLVRSPPRSFVPVLPFPTLPVRVPSLLCSVCVPSPLKSPSAREASRNRRVVLALRYTHNGIYVMGSVIPRNHKVRYLDRLSAAPCFARPGFSGPLDFLSPRKLEEEPRERDSSVETEKWTNLVLSAETVSAFREMHSRLANTMFRVFLSRPSVHPSS